MSLADQLAKLQTLRAQGALSEEEFTLAKKRVIEGVETETDTPRENTAAPSSAAAPSALHQLRRSTRDRWIGGVCGGLGDMTNIPTWSWRILFILALLLHGMGLVLYVLLWIFVPLRSEVPPVAKVDPG